MAKETEGGTWVNVNGNDEKGHVNIYGSDPKEPHDESIHININYEKAHLQLMKNLMEKKPQQIVVVI